MRELGCGRRGILVEMCLPLLISSPLLRTFGNRTLMFPALRSSRGTHRAASGSSVWDVPSHHSQRLQWKLNRRDSLNRGHQSVFITLFNSTLTWKWTPVSREVCCSLWGSSTAASGGFQVQTEIHLYRRQRRTTHHRSCPHKPEYIPAPISRCFHS